MLKLSHTGPSLSLPPSQSTFMCRGTIRQIRRNVPAPLRTPKAIGSNRSKIDLRSVGKFRWKILSYCIKQGHHCHWKRPCGNSLNGSSSPSSIGRFDKLTLLKMWSETTPQTIFLQGKLGDLRRGLKPAFWSYKKIHLKTLNVQTIKFRFKQGFPISGGHVSHADAKLKKSH